MKKIIALTLTLVLTQAVWAAPAANKPAAKTQPKTKAEIIVIEDAEYDAGKEDVLLTQGIAQFLEAQPVVTRMTVQEALQDPKLAQLDYSFLPLYLVKKTKAIRTKMEKPISYGAALEGDEFIILPHQTRQGVYANKEAKKGVMELFVMSQCPYGVRAEDLIIKAKKDGKFPSDKTVRVRYIVNYHPSAGFSSLHGSGEWEENVRQLLIAKYYPEKFWKYLEIRNKDYRSSRWDKAMEDAGINPKKIMKKFDSEGLELLKAEAAYVNEYGVSASPSLVWEGKVKLGLDSAAKIEGFEFFNPKTSDNPTAAVPAGSC